MKAYVLIIAAMFTGCVADPVLKKVPGEQHDSQSRSIEKAIMKIARTGDWLVIRGYHATDNLVSNVTGVPISHVGVLDAGAGMVIEAEANGVHLSSLRDFVDKSHRLLIIRPRWLTKDNTHQVLVNAKSLVGKNYDFLGTIGFDFPDQYYCSELAVKIYEPWYGKKERFPKVIKPGQLYLYGRVLYDSRPRDEI